MTRPVDGRATVHQATSLDDKILPKRTLHTHTYIMYRTTIRVRRRINRPLIARTDASYEQWAAAAVVQWFKLSPNPIRYEKLFFFSSSPTRFDAYTRHTCQGHLLGGGNKLRVVSTFTRTVAKKGRPIRRRTHTPRRARPVPYDALYCAIIK